MKKEKEGKGKGSSEYLRKDLKEVREWIILISGESASGGKTTSTTPDLFWEEHGSHCGQKGVMRE